VTRYLVTSALPYINGVKHLGNLIGSMLPADVYTRYLRARGEEVIYICATDEHGTPAELAALEAGLDVAEYCRVQHDVQADLGERFRLSFDWFGRSSAPSNHEITHHFADELERNGFIYEQSTEQLYSLDDGRFLPDRYVIGTCPHCGYESARGDQCENCTRLLDPTDLINPRSAISGSTRLELRTSRHLFLRQSALAEEVRAWIGTRIGWPVLATSIAYKWLDEGVRDRNITRDISWGVPVNRPGFEGKVFYVWFDAPLAYIAATRDWSDADPDGKRNWREWWYEAEDVHYVQFMAKDNVPFHTVGFPSSELGTREPWTMVDYLKAFNWLNYYGGKFSTSQHHGIFMSDALDLLPSDYWRWYLVANAPESSDTSFTWELFASTVNKDLADIYGNFVNRTLTLTARTFDGAVPEWSPGEPEERLAAELAGAVHSYNEHLGAMQFRRAAQQLRAIWSAGNAYLNAEAPWKALKEDPERGAAVLATAVNLVQLFAILSEPIIPDAAQRTLAALGVDGDQWPREATDVPAFLQALPPGHRFEVPEVLFRKVTDDEVGEWRERFGGSEEVVAG
jgi:methionyl-tRNA synthetase